MLAGGIASFIPWKKPVLLVALSSIVDSAVFFRDVAFRSGDFLVWRLRKFG